MGIVRRSSWTIVSFVLMLLFCTSVLKADVTGSIQGVVRDRSQGIVSGARGADSRTIPVTGAWECAPSGGYPARAIADQ